MDEYKIENFCSEHPGKQFPWYRPLKDGEIRSKTDKIKRGLGLTEKENGGDLVKKIQETGVVMDGLMVTDASFSLSNTLKIYGIRPRERVYLNWYQFDELDEIRFQDFDRYFDDIWYPETDDLDFFDDSFHWIVSVTHGGTCLIVEI